MPDTKYCAVEHYARDRRVTEVYGGSQDMQWRAIVRQILSVK
jgi:alkylation response protein AidB-like acyl-CoA dehydrogenase